MFLLVLINTLKYILLIFTNTVNKIQSNVTQKSLLPSLKQILCLESSLSPFPTVSSFKISFSQNSS